MKLAISLPHDEIASAAEGFHVVNVNMFPGPDVGCGSPDDLAILDYVAAIRHVASGDLVPESYALKRGHLSGRRAREYANGTGLSVIDERGDVVSGTDYDGAGTAGRTVVRLSLVGHHAVYPPSTSRTWPVMKSPIGDAKTTTQLAISTGSATR